MVKIVRKSSFFHNKEFNPKTNIIVTFVIKCSNVNTASNTMTKFTINLSVNDLLFVTYVETLFPQVLN